jgi:hypothetical protein
VAIFLGVRQWKWLTMLIFNCKNSHYAAVSKASWRLIGFDEQKSGQFATDPGAAGHRGCGA